MTTDSNNRLATVEFHRDELGFSAGHFTIFSATEREDLHGHNYYVDARFQVRLTDNGMAFDYRIYKNKIRELCAKLHLKFLLPSQSKFLKIEDQGAMWFAHFNNEPIPFLKRDALILPLCNITIEELSNWFLQHLTQDKNDLKKYQIHGITIRVFNGPGQSGGATWNAN